MAAAINQRIAQQLQALDSAQAFALLEQHDVPAAPVVEPAAVSELPQFAQRGEFDTGAAITLVRYPVPMAGMHSGSLGPAPELDKCQDLRPWRRSFARASLSSSGSSTRS